MAKTQEEMRRSLLSGCSDAYERKEMKNWIETIGIKEAYKKIHHLYPEWDASGQPLEEIIVTKKSEINKLKKELKELKEDLKTIGF